MRGHAHTHTTNQIKNKNFLNISCRVNLFNLHRKTSFPFQSGANTLRTQSCETTWRLILWSSRSTNLGTWMQHLWRASAILLVILIRGRFCQESLHMLASNSYFSLSLFPKTQGRPECLSVHPARLPLTCEGTGACTQHSFLMAP